jgi:hypothetical protein
MNYSRRCISGVDLGGDEAVEIDFRQKKGRLKPVGQGDQAGMAVFKDDGTRGMEVMAAAVVFLVLVSAPGRGIVVTGLPAAGEFAGRRNGVAAGLTGTAEVLQTGGSGSSGRNHYAKEKQPGGKYSTGTHGSKHTQIAERMATPFALAGAVATPRTTFGTGLHRENQNFTVPILP